MKSKTKILIATLMLIPAPVLAQQGQTEGQVRAAADATAEARAATPDARIESALGAAVEAGIPVSLLESKVQEGRAKGVPMERLAAAVEARLQALLTARTALDRAGAEAVSDGELLVAAQAVQAGVSENALIRITREAPRERRAVATAILTDLVRVGYESGQASVRVNAALKAGPDALIDLRAEAAAALQARGELVTELTGGLTGGLDL